MDERLFRSLVYFVLSFFVFFPSAAGASGGEAPGYPARRLHQEHDVDHYQRCLGRCCGGCDRRPCQGEEEDCACGQHEHGGGEEDSDPQAYIGSGGAVLVAQEELRSLLAEA